MEWDKYSQLKVSYLLKKLLGIPIIITTILKGKDRANRLKKNIIASFLIKVIGILLTFIMVPLLVNYLDPIRYGLWLTITSIVQWLWFFDVGLGNGLRNKFAEAVTLNEKEKARIYVSSAYFILFVISILLLLVFTPIILIIDWSEFFNAAPLMLHELRLLVLFVFIFSIMRFLLQLVGVLLLGSQKSAINDLINPLSNLLSIIFIFIIKVFYDNSFLYVGIALTSSPVFIYLLFSGVLFNSLFRDYRPSLRFIDVQSGRSLLGLGFYFFLVQLSGIVLYSTTNLLIIHLVGPYDVTEYNIAYKYFSSIAMLFSIVVTPFWSAFTEAHTIKDFAWIKRIINKLRRFAFLSIGILLGMLLLSNIFYSYWVGNSVPVRFKVSVGVAIMFAILIYSMPFSYYFNGIGRVREQAIMSVFVSIFHVPLSIFLVKVVNMGVDGILVSLIIVLIPSVFFWPYLYKKEMSKNDLLGGTLH